MPPRRYTDDELAHAVATSRTMRDVLVALGLAPYGGNYETVRNRIRYLGLDASHLWTFRRDGGVRDSSDADIARAVKESRSLAEVLSRLGLRPGGNQGRLKARIMELGLDTSHLLGRGGGGEVGPQLFARGRSTNTSSRVALFTPVTSRGA
jgi:hypothetical protein